MSSRSRSGRSGRPPPRARPASRRRGAPRPRSPWRRSGRGAPLSACVRAGVGRGSAGSPGRRRSRRVSRRPSVPSAPAPAKPAPPLFVRLRRAYGAERPPDDPRKDGDEGGVVVRHLGPLEPQAELLGLLARLGVEVPADLEVVGDEADRRDEDVGRALRVERLEVVEDVGAEPGLAGRGLGLEAEAPFARGLRPGDELRGLQQLRPGRDRPRRGSVRGGCAR